MSETTPQVVPTAAEKSATETSAPVAIPNIEGPVVTDTVPHVTSVPAEEIEAASKAETKDPAAPAAATAPTDPSVPTWPTLEENHPINKLDTLLPELIKEADHDEIYGLKIDGSNDFHKKLILQKFLRANANDVEKAKEQLLEALKWRKEFNPLAAKGESFSKSRFGGLGYVTTITGVPESPNDKDVVTFNIYGAVKDNKATFEDINSFLRWRVGLMELGIARLNLAAATKPIPDYGNGPDPYQGIQVHDYLSVSFLRQDPHVKAASKSTIETFQKYYPETLSRKFFVNVPVVMGWVFSAIKLVLSKETVKKFTVLSYGKDLAGELGSNVPEVYGGKSGELSGVGETLKETDDSTTTTDPAAGASATAPVIDSAAKPTAEHTSEPAAEPATTSNAAPTAAEVAAPSGNPAAVSTPPTTTA